MQPENQTHNPEQVAADGQGVSNQSAMQSQTSEGQATATQPVLSEAAAMPAGIDESLVVAAEQRDYDASHVEKKGLPRWVKPIAITLAILTVLGAGAWAFFAFYWNSNEQVLLRIMAANMQVLPPPTNSMVSVDYKGMAMSADIDFATDGKASRFGFDSEVRYGSNRYDTSVNLIGDASAYSLKLKNPRQFLYDLSGVYAKTTQTDGMYDVLSSKIDDKWLELKDDDIESLAGTDKLTKAVSCTSRASAPLRESQMSQEEFADLFKQYPFMYIESGRNDTVRSIAARTYVLKISEEKLNNFIDNYSASESWRQAQGCYGQELKSDLKKLARVLEKDFTVTISVSKSTLKILKVAGSTRGGVYSIVFETIFSQEQSGDISRPASEVSVEDIKPELDPIQIWLEAQRDSSDGQKDDTEAKPSADNQQPVDTADR